MLVVLFNTWISIGCKGVNLQQAGKATFVLYWLCDLGMAEDREAVYAQVLWRLLLHPASHQDEEKQRYQTGVKGMVDRSTDGQTDRQADELYTNCSLVGTITRYVRFQ